MIMGEESKSNKGDDFDFLQAFSRFWTDLCLSMQSIKDIFHYLERSLLFKELIPDRQTFWAIALN